MMSHHPPFIPALLLVVCACSVDVPSEISVPEAEHEPPARHTTGPDDAESSATTDDGDDDDDANPAGTGGAEPSDETGAGDDDDTGEPMPPPTGPMSVLLFTGQTRIDHHHDNNGQGVVFFSRLAEAYGFSVDVAYRNSDFAAADLSQYDVVLFNGTFGEPLDDGTKQKLIDYIEQGGSWMGTHSVARTHYEWTYLWDDLMGWGGERPNGHPVGNKPGTVSVMGEPDEHPATHCIPAEVDTSTFWMAWQGELSPDHELLAVVNRQGLPDDHPVVWAREFPGGGRAIFSHFGRVYTSKFKDRASWEPGHLYGALRWAAHREGVDFECHSLPYDGATDPDYVNGE